MKHSVGSVIAGTLILAASPAFAAEDWYVGEGSHCSGNASVSSAIAAVLPGSLTLKPITPAGNFAAVLTPQSVSQLSKTSPSIGKTVKLSAKQAQDVRTAFLRAGDNTAPLLFKAGMALFSNFAVPSPLTNVSAGLLFDSIYARLDAPSTTLQNATVLVAEGGELSVENYLAESSAGSYLMTAQTYNVRVGAETRRVVFYACTFPIALNVTEFATVGPMNNKILRSIGGGVWRTWDVDTAAYEGEPLTYSHQDARYFYLLRPEMLEGTEAGQTTYRISTRGGSWDRKRSDQTNYLTLYAKVGAR